MIVSEFSKYNAFLADKLKLDMEDQETLSKEFEASPLHEPANLPKPITPKQPSASSSTTGRCTYLLKSGKNKGQPCNAKEALAGTCRCKTHAGKDIEEPVQPTEEKKTFAKSSASDDAPIDIKKEPIKTTKPKKGQDLKDMEQKPLMKVIEQRRNDIPIVKSKFGNYTHIGTSLTWDRDSMCVTGREMPNGTILPLSENDIQLCIANGWKYRSELKVNKEAREIDHPELYESDVSDSESDEDC